MRPLDARTEIAAPALDDRRAEGIARMILACVHREHPMHMVHVVSGDADVRPPRELNPAFFGSFDWHSAVHGHWSLIRLARMRRTDAWRDDVLAALATSFAPARLAGEVAYLSA